MNDIYGDDMFQPSLWDGIVFQILNPSQQLIAGLISIVPAGHGEFNS
jgi:hypothetical protein